MNDHIFQIISVVKKNKCNSDPYYRSDCILCWHFPINCHMPLIFYILSMKSGDLAEQARREGFDENVRF